MSSEQLILDRLEKSEANIMERLERLEQQVSPVADSARAIGELREDLAPRVNELVSALILELADIESDFQLEDLLHLLKKAMRNVKNLNFTLDQLKNLIDLATTAEPLLKLTIPQVIFFLDDLEQKNVFQIFRILLETLKKIGVTYTTEEMEMIGEGLVRLMEIAKKLTKPEALDLLEKTADLPVKVDISNAKPAGPFSMIWASGDAQLKEGVGVLLELTKGLATLKA